MIKKPLEICPNGDTPECDGYLLLDIEGNQLALIEGWAMPDLNEVFLHAGLYSA